MAKRKGYYDSHGWWRAYGTRKGKRQKRVKARRTKRTKSYKRPGKYYVTGPYKSRKGALNARPKKGRAKKWGKRWYKVWKRK